MEPVGDHELTAAPVGLVGQLPAQLAPTGTGDAPRQTAVTDHGSDVEILNHDHPETLGQRGGELVQPVGAGVGDLGVPPGHPGLGALPAF